MVKYPILSFSYRTKRGEKRTRQENLVDLVDVKGWKAIGNKLGNYLRMSSFKLIMNDNIEVIDAIKDENIDELTLFT